MNAALRSCLTVGVASITAAAVAFGPSVQEPTSSRMPTPTVGLVAAVQPQALAEQPPLLTILQENPLALLGPAATLGTLPPAPAPLAISIAPNLADTIDGIYIAVEPWVRYGFEVATAVVRWIPFVGWFAGQIMVFYNFFESMVASGVFNFTDWLRGDGGAVENLVDFGIDVGLAFVWLGLDELAQFVPLPPFCCYPPRPPVQGPFRAATETLASSTESAKLNTAAATEDSTGKPEPKRAKVDEVLEQAQNRVAQANETGDGEVAAVVKKLKAPKQPEDVTGPKASTSVAGQSKVRNGRDADTTESTKVSKGEKKADKDGTASATDTVKASDGSKRNKGEPKDDTPKKGAKE